MTERDLSTLLHDAATEVTVPTPPAEAVLGDGRRRLRRRRRAVWAAGTAAVVVVGLAAYAATAHRLDGGAPAPATASPNGAWAVAQGSKIQLSSGATATLPGKVKALYYTSAGTLARIGASPYTDAPTSTYWLVQPNGKVSDLGLSLGDRVPGTDPALPFVAYAEKGADASHWSIRLVDARTGDLAATVRLEGRFTWGGRVAPPVALDGDHVYVGLDGRIADVDWRTGRTRSVAVPAPFPDVRGGRFLQCGFCTPGSVSPTRAGARVIDLPSGNTVFTLPPTGQSLLYAPPLLSVDGSHVLVETAVCATDGTCGDEQQAWLYDVDTGRVVHIDPHGSDTLGWSATGALLMVDEKGVRACDADTGKCTTTPLTLDGKGSIRVSGTDSQ